MAGKQFENDEELFEGRNIKDETMEKFTEITPLFLPSLVDTILDWLDQEQRQQKKHILPRRTNGKDEDEHTHA
jgi:hypothetical protein